MFVEPMVLWSVPVGNHFAGSFKGSEQNLPRAMPADRSEEEGIAGSSPFIRRMHKHLSGCIAVSGASSTGSGVAWSAVPRLSWCQH